MILDHCIAFFMVEEYFSCRAFKILKSLGLKFQTNKVRHQNVNASLRKLDQVYCA